MKHVSRIDEEELINTQYSSHNARNGCIVKKQKSRKEIGTDLKKRKKKTEKNDTFHY